MPFNIVSKLKHQQIVALDWLKSRVSSNQSGLILAPTGFGKTLFSFLIHTHSVHPTEFSQTLIVVPNVSLIQQFQNEFIKHTDANSHSQFIFSFHGPDRYSEDIFYAPIIISTYATLVQEFKKNRDDSFIFFNSFQNIILDEAHRGLVNTSNITWKTIHAISSKFVWPLTATPIVNKPKDIVNIAKLAFIDDTPHNIILNDSFSCPKNIKDIPQKHVFHHQVHASGFQLFNYRCILHDVVSDFHKNDSSSNILAKITRLRVAAIHHMPNKTNLSFKQLNYPKFKLLIKLINIIPDGESAIVFSNFTSILSNFSRFCDLNHITNFQFHGKISPANNKRNINLFSNHKLSSVLIANTKKAGVGLNLQRANHVFFLEPSWNPAETSQAIGRVFRSGQTRQTFIHHLYDHKSIELWIHQLHLSKSQIHNDLMIHNKYSHKILPTDTKLLFKFIINDVCSFKFNKDELLLKFTIKIQHNFLQRHPRTT